ncbi:hypothetical protein ACWC5I_04215 [Kitasatospora sp. NPDC001574]
MTAPGPTLAFHRAARAQQVQLHRFLGCPTLTHDQAEAARRIIEATGARHTVEHMITDRYEQALAALEGAPFEEPVADALRRLAAQVVRRAA